jgi:hypothetical protein
MENRKFDEIHVEPQKLVGMLADEGRLKVVAAIALGARTQGEIRKSAGLDEATLVRLLGRLIASGIIEYQPNSGYRVRLEVFREAARSGRKKVDESASLESVLRNGRLPRSREDRLAVLEQLAALFEPGQRYPEADVNDRLKVINPDFALLRRYLIDEGLLRRANETTPNGRTVMVYWRTEPA